MRMYPGLHPFVQGLLDSLPEPGTEWSAFDRAKWLGTAAGIFSLMYEGAGKITVNFQAPEEPK